MTDEPTKPPERYTPAEGLREMVSVDVYSTGSEHGPAGEWKMLLPDYPRVGDRVEVDGDTPRLVKMVTWSTNGVTLRVE